MRSTAYRFRGTQQISLRLTRRYRDHPVANTPVTPMEIGLQRYWPPHPSRTPYGASLSFETVPHLQLPLDTPSRGPARPLCESARSPVYSEPRPCHIGDGFPPSGPRDRTCLTIDSPPIYWSCQSHQESIGPSVPTDTLRLFLRDRPGPFGVGRNQRGAPPGRWWRVLGDRRKSVRARC